MTTSQVVDMSVTVSPTQDYVPPDDHAQPTYEIVSQFDFVLVWFIKTILVIFISHDC